MDLDEGTCWRAVTTRDRRFEGRFVMGVRTTGVYCRPGCPARMPLKRNVSFFTCAAAAETAGFRPCRRCRPDASPGSPAWVGTSTTVARALKLIEAGALDDNRGVAALAERLGVGARHLRRLFLEHLGANPRDIAQTRRVHFAKRLLEETDLPMTAVAEAAGFPGVRRFNDAVRRSFQTTPGALRRRRGRPEPAESGGRRQLKLRLPYRAPLDWPRLLGFLRGRAIAGTEVVTPDAYRRAIDLPKTRGVLAVRPLPDAALIELTLELTTPLPGDLLEVTRRLARLFDLNADSVAIAAHLEKDAALQPALRRLPGLRVPGAWDPFEMAVRAILGQQVSVKGATTLMGRVVRKFGAPVLDSPEPLITHYFPAPAVLARANLSGLGLTGQRIATVRALAAAVADGRLRWDAFRDLDDAVAQLSALPGIGAWTAHYIAMRALGEPDAFPTGDLGLLKGLAALIGKPVTKRQLDERAEAWRPWRAYATLALWQGAPAAAAAPRRITKGKKS